MPRPSKCVSQCLVVLVLATAIDSSNEQCPFSGSNTSCAAAEPELEAKRAQARAFGKAQAVRYMERAENWVKQAQAFAKKNSLAQFSHENDHAFKLSWSGLNNIVAAVEYDPDSSTLWKKSAQMLLTMLLTNDGDPVQNSAVVLKFMQRAINLSDDKGVAVVKSLGSLLKKLDPNKEATPLWRQLTKWHKEPGTIMDMSKVAFGKGKDGDPPSTTPTKSDDPEFPMAPTGSPFLEDNLQTVKTGSLTTHQLWPTRVSVVNTIEEGLMTAEENDALSEACTDAHGRFEKRASKKGEDTGNSAFFHDQAEEMYDPDSPERVSPGFGRKSTSAAVMKLWRLQHNLSIQHIVNGGARPQRAEEFSRNVMFPWCAIYFEGTEHAAHLHEDAIVSGVYYSQTPRGASPLIISDPRGGTHMATSGSKAHKFVPEAPFHHQYHFHPKAGDMILFPSYLVHQVPSNPDMDPPRIAWPFNLFADLDAWSRINT